MVSSFGDAASSPRDLLAEARGIRSRTRRARQAFWFPLTLFGAIVLASTPLYLQGSSPGGPSYLMPQYFLGGDYPNAAVIAVYWLIAGPLGYLATAAFYWWRARRAGVATSVTAYVATGIGLFAVIVAVAALNLSIGDLVIRGLTPLFAIALGLFVLARLERSAGLAIFAVGYLALAFVANLYNMENLTSQMAFGPFGIEVNVIAAGVVLLVAGLVFQLSAVLAGNRR